MISDHTIKQIRKYKKAVLSGRNEQGENIDKHIYFDDEIDNVTDEELRDVIKQYINDEYDYGLT